MTDSTAKLEEQLKAAKRLLAIRQARESLLPFMKLRMPDPEYPDDVEHSRYVVTPQARLLCEVLEKVERGELLRVCVSIGPQLGKSELISRGFPAWFSGRNPYKHFMLGTYNQDFANDFGSEVREVMTSPAFAQVFPKFGLRKGSKAKDALTTTDGGKLAFLGRGGAGTGKPADLFVIDDPIKDDREAQSGTIRDEAWSWFNKVVYSRCHRFSAILIVHTRWHQDDLIGRLVDPSHPDHDPKIAREWTYINIPAVVKDPKLAAALGLTLEAPEDEDVIEMFGAEPMAALWPERKPLKFLASARRLDPRGFESLYQGNPAPEDGAYFTREMLQGYQPHELPRNLRIYGASDHALTEKKENDASVLGCAGMDEDGVLWILPDLVWKRMQTDRLVEEMINQMRHHRPQLWWAENEAISKAFGPFLRRRMREEGVYATVAPITPSKDLSLRARSIQGMASIGAVRFPKFAFWWPAAESQMLKFPNAAHDDFVSFLALLGLGLDYERSASRPRTKVEAPKVGSLAWVKYMSKHQSKRQKARATGGF